MALPNLPDAVGDSSGSADATTPSLQPDAGPGGGLSRSRERADSRGRPEQPSGERGRQRNQRGGLWLDVGRAESGHGSETVSDGLAGPDDPGGDQDGAARQLHPLPPGLVELYGLLAVLFVLVPEWMASGALLGLQEGRRGSELPPPSGAWKRLPELRLASLNLAELRQLAHERRLIGYSRQSRSELTARLLRHLKARP